MPDLRSLTLDLNTKLLACNDGKMSGMEEMVIAFNVFLNFLTKLFIELIIHAC